MGSLQRLAAPFANTISCLSLELPTVEKVAVFEAGQP
jgi:hypothetical protein